MKRDKYNDSSNLSMARIDPSISNMVNSTMNDLVSHTSSTISNSDWSIAIKLILNGSFNFQGQIDMDAGTDNDMEGEVGMEQSLEQSLEKAYELVRV